jgi:HSP20 family molecular chaperone IbpA
LFRCCSVLIIDLYLNLRCTAGDGISSPARSFQSSSVSQSSKPAVLSQEGGRGLLDEFNNLVARRAYERFDRDGRVDGNDLSHWLEAENELVPLLPYVRDLPDSFTANVSLSEVSTENVKVCAAEDRAIVYAENRAADGSGQTQSIESNYYLIRWPEPVDASSCTAELEKGDLTLQVRKAKGRPESSANTSRDL